MFCMVGERCPENKTLLRNTTDSDWSAGCFIMEQKKKVHTGLLSIFLGIILCLSMLPAMVFAEVGIQTQNEEVGTLSEQNLVQTQDEGQTVAPSDLSDSSAAQAQDEGTATEPITSSDQSNSSSAAVPGSSSEQDAALEANPIVAAEGEVASVTPENGVPSSYTTIEDAFTAANAAGKATITLQDNCTVTATTSLQINTGSDITLDLNGYTLTGNGQTSVITVNTNGTFALNGSGTITGGNADNGGGVFVAGTFTMAGSTISGNSARSVSGIGDGGGVYVGSDARFTMTGGVISGNSAHNRAGGGVYVDGGTFTMKGGTISNNNATRGVGVSASSDATFIMEGGAISNNHGVSAANGAGVYVNDSAAFTMRGGTISENVTDDGNGGGVYVGGSASFTMENGVISRNATDRQGSGGGVYTEPGTTFTLINGEISENSIRARADSYYGGGVYAGGYFIMKGGIITKNTTGFSILYTASCFGNGVCVGDNATFIMEDGTISENKSGDGTRLASYGGGGVYVGFNASFTMESGTISGNTALASAGTGGGVYSDGPFTINGGTISGNTAGHRGGGIYSAGTNYSGVIITIKGGTISGNTARNGGGVYSSGPFIMNDSEVSGNTATETDGGGVVVTSDSVMNNSIISGNSASRHGGGVYINSATFTMESDTISGNTATGYGGGVYIQNGTFAMESGTISENTADLRGGGFYLQNSALSISGGIITGNSAGYTGGGILCYTYSSVTLSGNPVVSGNSSAYGDAAGENAEDNVALTGNGYWYPFITLDGLTDGAYIGISAYKDWNNWIEPTFAAPVQFTTAETDTDFYTKSAKYFFSDRPGFISRANADGKYLELIPQECQVTFDPQGGTLQPGEESKTVIYGQEYGNLPTPTWDDNHFFAGWSLKKQEDTPEDQRTYIGEDTLVNTPRDHTLYAHWQTMPEPEIQFEKKTYTYDGEEHPFDFTVVNGPDRHDGLWKIYYFEHTGDFHEKPIDASQFSEEPPVNVDDYCIIITHPATDTYAFFESEFIHNGIIINPVGITVSVNATKSYDGSPEIPITKDDLTITGDIVEKDKDKVRLVVADDAKLILPSAEAGTNGAAILSGVYLEGDDYGNHELTLSATGSITDAAEEALTYTLTFETNGGSAVDSISAKSGTTVDLSAYTSAREGFSFNGWYSDPTLANKVESVTLTGDMTVYAGWTEGDTGRGSEPGDDPGDNPNADPGAGSDSDSGDDATGKTTSDDGSTLPLTGMSLQMGLFLVAICSLSAALIVLQVSRTRKKGNNS